MIDEKPPQLEGCPGIAWFKRKHGWEGRWRARADIIEDGYLPKSVRLWVSSPIERMPMKVSAAWISSRCLALQNDMLEFARTKRSATPFVSNFDGTLKSLIDCYQHDKDSPYKKLRYVTRTNYDGLLNRLNLGTWIDDTGETRAMSDVLIRDIKARVLLSWHRDWSEDGHISMAHSMVGMVRTLMTFGSTILDSIECRLVKVILHDMKFENGKAREESLSPEQVIAIRAMAHRKDIHSMALAQAFQFECTFRQKDVIGEWIPMSEPEFSTVHNGNEKWLRGIRWEEIDEKFVLRHVTSKKLKPIECDLHYAPMVIEELRLLAGGDLNRGKLPASGPIIVNERTGVPYREVMFRRDWRKLARACGIPDAVRNMDSRSGAISEATDAGVPLENVRHAAAHSNTATTMRYSRNSAEKIASTMKARVESRNK